MNHIQFLRSVRIFCRFCSCGVLLREKIELFKIFWNKTDFESYNIAKDPSFFTRGKRKIDILYIKRRHDLF